jgi:hypothetical protein
MSKALLVLVAVAALVTAAAGSAQATKSHAMTFTLDGRIVAADTIEGTWAASGALEAAGRYSERFQIVGDEIDAIKILEAPDGMIVVAAKAHVDLSSEGVATFTDGDWSVLYGTGVYSKLKAGGRPAATPESFGNLLTGQVHIVHVGRVHGD